MMWWLLIVLVFGILAYHRAALTIWLISYALLMTLAVIEQGFTVAMLVTVLILAAIFIPLSVTSIRRRYLVKPVLNFYRRIMPTMSRTEREAISAGTVTWEADIFRGNPDWNKLLAQPHVKLSVEEQAFMEGPVNALCLMLDDWDITHNRADLPEHVWSFLKEQGFFALIIPKQYGGKEFSAYAHSEILVKVSGRSVTAASTIAVPNSLGPAELLLHYGTDEQKNYYLPRLARGLDVPCFALTAPNAGSDASSMTDHGIVCRGQFEGKDIIGIRLQFDKRYITLAPVATVIGLAFKLFDPDHLIGEVEDIGITCALLPRNTPGMQIGRRHFPLNTPFQNGPIHGKDVFIPLDWIIGGVAQAGNGWRMLMECLAAGRSISLPAEALGGSKLGCYTTGAYARIRKQFHTPIGRFEGIEEAMARMGGFTYLADAGRMMTLSAIDSGEKPSIASAIIKYHATELGRKVGLDAMDIHGGKGICLGPNNYLGRGYEAMPIGITVEGANILTRSLIIFGQGAMRCHPYVFPELEAARMKDDVAALEAFDNVLMKHIAFSISNVVRSFFLGLTGGYLVFAPASKMHRYYQQATRLSSAFAMLSDVCFLVFGGALKRKESLSARLGDILSYLYLLSAVLKRFKAEGEKTEDLPLVRYAGLYCLFEVQERFADILKNLPSKPLAMLLRVLIFPWGERFHKPQDRLGHKIAQLMMNPGGARDRLTQGVYVENVSNNVLAVLNDALLKSIAAEPIEKTIRAAKLDTDAQALTLTELAKIALQQQLITHDQFNVVSDAEIARAAIIKVDDFSPDELMRTPQAMKASEMARAGQ